MQAEVSENATLTSADILFPVEEILDRVIVDGKKYYRIKWKGYPLNQATWEPPENLVTIPDLVVNFDIRYDAQNGDPSNAEKRPAHRSLSDEEKEPEKKIKGEKMGKKTHSKKKNKSKVLIEKEKPKCKRGRPKKKETTLGMITRPVKLISEHQNLQVNSNEITPRKDENELPTSNATTLEKVDSTPRKGSLGSKDKPKTVLEAQIISDTECRFLVSWELDPNGVLPEPSYVTNQELKNSNPVFLIEFYEKLIKHNLIKSGQYYKLPKSNNNQIIQFEPIPEDSGSFAFHDKPKSIINIQNFYQSGCDFLVDWHGRCSGPEPCESVVNSESFKNHNPLLLIEYYEKKLKPSPDYAKNITINIPEKFHHSDFIDELLKDESAKELD